MREKPSHVPSRRRRRSICPSQPRPAIADVPSPAHSLEPEVVGDRHNSKLRTTKTSSWGRRDMMRSTIYSGSPGLADVAMKKIYEGRHHSPWRRSIMGSPSWHGSGSSSTSSRPPVFARQTAAKPYESLKTTQSRLIRLNRSLYQRRTIALTTVKHRNHHAQQTPSHRNNRLLLPPSSDKTIKDMSPTRTVLNKTPGPLD